MGDDGQFYPQTMGEGRVQIWAADCLAVMAAMDDNCVDQVFCDPPFEKHMHVGKSEKAHPRGRKIRADGYADLPPVNFDSIEPVREAAALHMVRICRGWLIVFCTPEGVAPWRDAIEAAGGRYKRACYWIKPDAAPQFNGQGPAMGGEMFVAAWCGTGHAKWNAGGKRGVYTYPTNNRDRDGRHPTEKPVLLMRELTRDFARDGDLIFDPFMGSGTTGVAALIEGRRFAGVEMNRDWFEVAHQRLGWQIDGKGPIARASERNALTTPDAPVVRDLLSGVV